MSLFPNDSDHDHLDDNELFGNKFKQYLCLQWQILRITESMYFMNVLP